MPENNPRQEQDETLRIDPDSNADVSFWADKLNLSEDQLRGLIAQVGPRVMDIEMVIGKYTPTSNPR